MILPACNTEAMNLHLVEIAKTVAPGAHAVLMVDQAGWHMSTRLVVPPNITIIALPPKSPELNPVENVWQFMRDNEPASQLAGSYRTNPHWVQLNSKSKRREVDRLVPVERLARNR